MIPRVLVIVLLGVAAAAIKLQLPEIKRYVKMSRM
jgi:hypothetical protein